MNQSVPTLQYRWYPEYPEYAYIAIRTGDARVVASDNARYIVAALNFVYGMTEQEILAATAPAAYREYQCLANSTDIERYDTYFASTALGSVSTHRAQCLLAQRIVAALNLTAHIQLDDLEAMGRVCTTVLA